MNERIKDLAEQAKIQFYNLSTGESDNPQICGAEQDLEKFAELIVQECLNAIVATNQRPSNENDLLMFSAGLLTAIDGIKKHFGVN
jgi:hypothetical protein